MWWLASGHQCMGADPPHVYQAHCRESLGMHNGQIPDRAITASSAYDINSVGPQNARIRTERKGGAWCPKTQIKEGSYEYLQVDLGGLKVITLVETQGRFGNGQGQEFAETYMLEYQREDDGDWKKFKDRRDKQLLKGNHNTYIAELREINPPIIARRVRFIPYSHRPRTVCMRVELYGCAYTDGILSYQIPQGGRRGSEVNMFDFTYDGRNQNGLLTDGLGQLVDLEEGDSNFRLDKQGLGKKGYEWIGWRNDSLDATHSRPVEIIFKFDRVRNFSLVTFHCNNMFSKDIRVFRQAKIWFSIGGRYYNQKPVAFDYMKDTLIEYARKVVVPIPNKTGRFVKIELYFEARWIMISEIQFESEIAVGRFKPELPILTNVKSPDIISPGDKMSSKIDVQVLAPKGNNDAKPGADETPTKSPISAVVHPQPRDEKTLREEHIGIIIGALAALILLLFAIAIFIILRHRNKKKANSKSYSTFDKHRMTGELDDFKSSQSTNGALNGYHMYNVVATSDADFEETTSFQKLKLNELYRDVQESQFYEQRKVTDLKENEMDGNTPNDRLSQSPLYVKLPPEPVFQNTFDQDSNASPSPHMPHGSGPPKHPPPPIPPPPNPIALYKIHDIVNPLAMADMNGNDSPLHGATGSSGSGSSGSSGSGSSNKAPDRGILPLEFPRECLKFIEKIGDGDFGEIHLCEAHIESNGKKRPRSTLVAVKILSNNANNIARDNFNREAQVLFKLKDPNVAGVLGVCMENEPLYMVLEYSRHGDLHQFLRQHIPEDAVVSNGASGDYKILSYGALIYMASQVASGMKYLESLNMVHRDLATRNCLVGHHYTVKICDLGMCRSQYSRHYYRLEGRAVMPVRWMAWESVMLGKFSSKSDAWSFAVTMWEMLTFARQQPFTDLTDEQVIDNCSRFFKQDGLELNLPQPSSCTKEIYDLMKECWKRDESLRPSFREIHMFLLRKNMGYDPKDDCHRNTIQETVMI